MTIAYKTKVNKNGNVKRIVVNYDKKTYSFDECWSHMDLVVKAKELKELLTILKREGYTRA